MGAIAVCCCCCCAASIVSHNDFIMNFAMTNELANCDYHDYFLAPLVLVVVSFGGGQFRSYKY